MTSSTQKAIFLCRAAHDE